MAPRKASERQAGSAAPRAPAGLAFFDFDNTLIHGDAGPLFGQFMFRIRRDKIRARRGRARAAMLTLRYVPYVCWMTLQAGLYKLGARRRSSIVRSAYLGLRGVPLGPFMELMDSFVASMGPRIYPEMVRAIERHQKAGITCVVLTTGMEPLVAGLLAAHFPLGVKVIGCRLRIRDGRLTGRVDGPLYGQDKANILDAYARALGVSVGDCWAYSDHYSDKQMLEVVGHAVVVNPRGRLRRLAAKMKWKILEPTPHAT